MRVQACTVLHQWSQLFVQDSSLISVIQGCRKGLIARAGNSRSGFCLGMALWFWGHFRDSATGVIMAFRSATPKIQGVCIRLVLSRSRDLCVAFER